MPRHICNQGGDIRHCRDALGTLRKDRDWSGRNTMAKLYFRYGAMNSSKSALLLTAAYNYEERDQHPVLVKPGVDTKAGRAVTSRVGIELAVDVSLQNDT